MSMSGSNSGDKLQKLLSTVARAVKLSQELPSSNTPAFIYYSDFPQYKNIASGQSRKILTVSQHILDQLDAKTNVLDIPNVRNIKEKFSSVVDANDRILERLSVAMDEEEDPGRRTSQSAMSENLVVASRNTGKTSIEWLHSKNKENASVGLDEKGLRLLSSKNVLRPQTLFSKPPDNSSLPFRPKLVCKPNSQTQDSALEERDYDENVHPYEHELDAFSSCLSDYPPLLPEKLSPKPFNDEFRYVEDVDQLNRMLADIAICKEIAVDLEHHNFRSYLGFTCLIQLTSPTMDYVVDALTLRDHLYRLNEVFTDPKIVKVFHGADWDLMWLQRDFNVYVVNMFDTGLAARALQLGRFSLSFLMQRYVNVRPNKQFQLADWRIRPLPAELLEYARSDTHYLLYIAACMSQELQDRNLLPVVFERSRQLCLKCYRKPAFNPLGYLDLYRQAAGGGASFSHRQLYALERLYALRDTIARQEDESIQYVLPNHMLRVIAEVLPREPSGMFACCNPIPPLVRKYVHELHKVVLDSRERPLNELPLASDLLELKSESTANRTGEGTPSGIRGGDPHVVMAAPPHDLSHPIEEESIADSFVVDKLLGHSSSLGMTIGLPCVNSQESLPLCWFSRLPEPNRMLLTKILGLLAKPLTDEIGADERVAIDVSEPSATADPTQTAEKDTPAEEIIPLRTAVADDRTPALTQSTTRPTESTSSGQTKKTKKGKFDPSEVVLLRNEMSKVSGKPNRKRPRRRQRDKQGKTSQVGAPSSSSELVESLEGAGEQPEQSSASAAATGESHLKPKRPRKVKVTKANRKGNKAARRVHADKCDE